MLKKTKSKVKTVAEKVAELIAHPNQSGSDTESEDEATAPRVIDFDEDEYQLPEAGTTDFRKRNVKLLSEQSLKYKGKIASRKDFEEEEVEYEESDGEDEEVEEGAEYEDSDEEDENLENGVEHDSDSEEDDEALKEFSKALRNNRSDHKIGDVSEGEDEDTVEGDMLEENDDEDDDDDDVEENDVEEEEDEENGDDDGDEETEVISKVNHEAEIQKGICVQNQLRLWERLLELRINTQKILSKANQLPVPLELTDLGYSNDKHKSTMQETTKQTKLLLQNLVFLQDTLYTQFPELNKAMKPSLKRTLPFKEPNNGEPPLKQVNSYLQERFETFRTYRNSILLKWDDRTKLLTPGAGAKKKSMNEEYDIIKKIDNTLMNKSMLIQKSQQTKNAQSATNGSDGDNQSTESNLNTNIYDDTEFYHQQLRELIEYKANTSNNMSEVTKQFLELQKLRQKMKKKVDTRASKGRKIRYVVHNKLINFMAPHDNSTWNEESKDELCKSLFV